jgi:coatomer subunit beta'
MSLNAVEEILQLLIKTERLPEEELKSKGKNKVAESLADPANYANLFPELSTASAAKTEGNFL